MQILDQIPFDLNEARVLKRARIRPRGDGPPGLSELMERARNVARPKAAYAEVYVHQRKGDSVTLSDVTFTSRTLRTHLDGVERAFPYVVTCGRELEETAVGDGDPLAGYLWDAIKNDVLRTAVRYLKSHLVTKYGLGEVSMMSPGSGDETIWPLAQQRQLFRLLGDVRDAVGVELTDHFLMLPTNSVSGILFPTEVPFFSCQLCHRNPCPSRRAPFDEELWREMRSEEGSE